MGRVDCEAEQEIAQRFHITKYPTLKMWRNAQVMYHFMLAFLQHLCVLVFFFFFFCLTLSLKQFKSEGGRNNEIQGGIFAALPVQ